MHNFSFAILTALALIACGDNTEPEPGPPPLCSDLGCPAALCAGACTCIPPGEDPIDCRASDAAGLVACPDVGCPGSVTNRRESPACTAAGCVCGADPVAPVACAPTCAQLGCAAGTGTCDAPGFPLTCS